MRYLHFPNRWFFKQRYGLLALFLMAIAFPLIIKFFPSSPSPSHSAYAYTVSLNLPGISDRTGTIQREIDFYQVRLQADPHSGLNLAGLANAYWKMGKATGEVSWYLRAEQFAQRSLASLPFFNSGAELTLAQIAQARHDFKTAMRIAQKVLQQEPNHLEAQSLLITCHLAIGNLTKADRLVTDLVNQMPNLETLTLQGLVQEAQGHPDTVETFRLAIQAEEAGEMGNSAFARVLLGRHFYQRGKLEAAADLYREALRIIPRYPLALLNLATLETRRGNYAEAENLYNQVKAYSQQSTTMYDHTVLRGKARLQQLQGGDFDQLLQQAETLLRQETNAGHEAGAFGHRRELAQLLLDRDRPTDRQEALALMQVERTVRQDVQTLSVLALALARTGKLTEAQTVLRSAIQRGTQDAALFTQAAQLEQQLGNAQQATRYQTLAKQIDPHFDQQAQQAIGFEPL
ncbi:MAG: tetratricopeptide repeat protein [Synechococcales bacterium]|nr:tetratricopeptide repeat protein [Synechococcales bacterium]